MSADDLLMEEPASLSTPQEGLARSAGLLSVGNAASRVLGLVREMVIAYYFGASGQVSAFRVASQVPTMLYDFLIGGMLSAALVPVLSEYARLRRRSEFYALVGALISVFAVVLAGLVLLLELAAPWLAWLLAAGLGEWDPALLTLTTRLIRLAAPAVWLLSMAGLFTGMLYALQRFTFPALATAIYNLGIVAMAPLLAPRIGIYALALGMLAGGLVQLALLAGDLRRAGVPLLPGRNWYHPALGRMLRLYLPIAAGLVVSLLQVAVDRRLASGTGAQSIAWMSNATTLQQMPLGLISVAISLAALPRLSQHFAAGDEAAYRHTLGRGLRMVLLLIVPAAVGLWLLGEPLARLLFERNRFTPEDTRQVVAALNIYVVGMLFAAVDFPLNYAFYARHNTWLPALVGVASVGIYLAVALSLVNWAGFLGLVWADSAKQAGHALIMVALLGWQLRRWPRRLARDLAGILMAAGGMALAMAATLALLSLARPWQPVADLLALTVAGGVGLGVYGLLLQRLGMAEAQVLYEAVVRRVVGRRGACP
ncbi:murein biosynthesis integral membrane protein MurJ [Litorilinea aerophila]|uniref:Probable lipid II flippase MurJ n=1 Tax=Litorilinea aerophila TaxID=1204385 RepID=A0A540V9Y4_9CHLR|nr:murein biosynthesis integral membrane protein MurJ [Litorilinea aerophila]MCC9078621.1 murein biosynthesis integral membrane protein MurJ [Litorilinea aerophila]